MTSQLIPHLRCHSEYSLTHGMIKLEGDFEIGKLAAERGIGAVALTDTNNLHAAIRFQASCKRHGVKPLLGCHAKMRRDTEQFFATFICQNAQGFVSLSKILSNAQLHHNGEIIAAELNPDNTAGLFMFTGYDGDVATALRTGEVHRAQQRLKQWKSVFDTDRFCCEMSFAGRDGEEALSLRLNELASKQKIASVATHPLMFANQENYADHEVRTCIATQEKYTDPERSSGFSQNQYLWSQQEMRERFADWPDALANAREIALRCNYDFGVTDTPQFPRIAASDKSAASQLRDNAHAGLADLGKVNEGYSERLEHELQIIIDKGFTDYFLIVAEFVSYAKSQDIPVGPGRGSGAGSLVAYALGITGIDPLEYGLLFERFLNPERTSLPDFDIDFCKRRRDEIIAHAQTKYGQDCVAQVVTFGTLKAKAVVRDVARVLGMPYSVGDYVARLIPDELNITLARARLDNTKLEEFLTNSDENRQLWEFSLALEGLPRQASTHAAAILIAPRPLVEFCPVIAVGDRNDRRIVSQYDMDAVASIGLIKFDFLGLRNLTAIHVAEQRIAAATGKQFNLAQLVLKGGKALDPVFNLYKEGRTIGIFQCESPGMISLLRQLEPISLDDIAITISLFRPGVLSSNMHETYLKARQGLSEVQYPHQLASKILEPTYGVMIYQEQIMQLSQALAGFSLAKADQLRAAIGKKDANAMNQLKQEFLTGCANHLKSSDAKKLFEDIRVFAGYGFNKSHAIAYALISLQTAYLKACYPEQFYAAVLDSCDDDPVAQLQLLKDALRTKPTIDILPPCVNTSQERFSTTGMDQQIRFGLSSVRDVGFACAKEIIAERNRAGEFTSLDNFCERFSASVLNRRALENLIRSGACDCLVAADIRTPAQSRPWLLSQAEGALDYAADQHNLGAQENLFDATQTDQMDAVQAKATARWSNQRLLISEQTALGIPLSGHFFTAAKWLCQNLPLQKHTDLQPNNQQRLWAGNVTKRIKSSKLRRQEQVVFLLNDDYQHQDIEVIIDAAAVENIDFDQPGIIVIVTGTVEQNRNRAPRIKANKVISLEHHCANRLRGLTCQTPDKFDRFFTVINKSAPGKTKVHITLAVTAQDQTRQVMIDTGLAITPTPEELNELRGLVGAENLKLDFKDASF